MPRRVAVLPFGTFGPHARYALAAVIAAVGMTLSSAGAGGPQPAASAPRPQEALRVRDLVWMQLPSDASADPRTWAVSDGDATRLPLGTRIVRNSATGGRGQPVVLSRGFAAAGHPDVSFDGRRILLVGRRQPGDPDHIWEMDRDGSHVRRVTPDDLRIASNSGAIYLPTIYTIDAQTPVYQIAFCAIPSGSLGRAGSVYTCRLDGTGVRRITFAPGGAFDPYVLADGRLLFSTQVADIAAGSPSSDAGMVFMTVNTDGTDVFPFFGAHGAPTARGMPVESQEGYVYFVESAGQGTNRATRIACVRRSRSLHTHRSIAGEPGDQYATPYPLVDGSLLVAYRDNGDPTFGLWLMETATGVRSVELADSPDYHDMDAVPLAPRREPDGRSSVVDERAKTGRIYCLNAYLSDPVPLGKRTQKGVSTVRVFERVDGQSANNEAHEVAEPTRPAEPVPVERLLGEVPVEKDGSFHLEVPARVPLRFETVGPKGEMIQRMRSWMWVMPKEARGCIGCHEDRELSPPNRFVDALRKPAHRLGVAEKERDHERSVGPAYARPEE